MPLMRNLLLSLWKKNEWKVFLKKNDKMSEIIVIFINGYILGILAPNKIRQDAGTNNYTEIPHRMRGIRRETIVFELFFPRIKPNSKLNLLIFNTETTLPHLGVPAGWRSLFICHSYAKLFVFFISRISQILQKIINHDDNRRTIRYDPRSSQ